MQFNFKNQRHSRHGKSISFLSLTIDKTNIYIWQKLYLYFEKKYALFERVDAFKCIQKIKTPFQYYNLYVFDKSLQSYPPTRCLIPDKKVYNIEEEVTVATNSIIVNLLDSIPKNRCKRYNLPTTIYTINISHCLDMVMSLINSIISSYRHTSEITRVKI